MKLLLGQHVDALYASYWNIRKKLRGEHAIFPLASSLPLAKLKCRVQCTTSRVGILILMHGRNGIDLLFITVGFGWL